MKTSTYRVSPLLALAAIASVPMVAAPVAAASFAYSAPALLTYCLNGEEQSAPMGEARYALGILDRAYGQSASTYSGGISRVALSAKGMLLVEYRYDRSTSAWIRTYVYNGDLDSLIGPALRPCAPHEA